MDQCFDYVTGLMHMDGNTMLTGLIVASVVCQAVGKLIPDDATGWKGVLRKGSKVVGLYVSNRITGNVSVSTIAKAAIAPPVVEEIADKIPEVAEAEKELPILTQPAYSIFARGHLGDK